MKAHYTLEHLRSAVHRSAVVCHSTPTVGPLASVLPRIVFWWQRHSIGIARPEVQKHARAVGKL